MDASHFNDELVTAIHARARPLVIAATGGGADAIAALLHTPGASRTVLEAIVPYGRASLGGFLCGEPESFCSEATARAMAMAAWNRARRLAPLVDPATLAGIGCTASLASDRVKRGAHRAFVAVQTAQLTRALSLTFADGTLSRASEEHVVSHLVLQAIAEAADVDGQVAAASTAILQRAVGDGTLSERLRVVPLQWTELLLGLRDVVVAGSESGKSPPSWGAIFPGAFNPPHAAHRRMAELANEKLGAEPAWEVSIANVDKPPSDFLAISDRVALLRQNRSTAPIVLTRAATFWEKARLFPGATFVVGADTIARIADVRYYGGAVDRDAALAEIASQGCRFLVFGRVVAGRFFGLPELELPAQLAAMCVGVSEAEFRQDVSSSEIRGN